MLKPIVIDFSSLKNNGFSCYLKGRSYDLQENFQTLDIEKAVYYYKKGYYEYNDILCQYSIAASLNDEMFIPFFDEEDKKVTFPKYEELEELSKQDNYEGICATFACAFYLNYGIGVDKDEQLAYNLIKSCADRGHVGAMYDLGTVPKFIKNIGEDESQRYLELASLGGSMRAKRKLVERKLKSLSNFEKRQNVKADYDKIASQYGEEFGTYIEDMDIYEVFKQHLKASGTILDLGAGTGRTFKYFNDLGYKYIGLDFSKRMQEEAYKIHGEFDYICDDMMNIRKYISNNSVDGVFAVYSLFHIPLEDFKQLISDVYEVLSDDGVFLLSYQKGNGEELANEPYLGNNGFNVLYMSYFDDDTVSNILKEYGFDIVFRKEKTEEVENAINSNNNVTSFVLARKLKNKK